MFETKKIKENKDQNSHSSIFVLQSKMQQPRYEILKAELKEPKVTQILEEKPELKPLLTGLEEGEKKLVLIYLILNYYTIREVVKPVEKP